MGSNNNILPPKWPFNILRWCLRKDYREEIEGDLEEIFNDLLASHDQTTARNLYRTEVVKLFRPKLFRKLSGSQQLNYYDMILLFFKVALRSLFRYRLVAGMSLLTLIIGTASFLMVYAWVHNEQTMDDFHSQKDKLYLAVARFNPDAALSAVPLQRIFNVDYSQYSGIKQVLVAHTYRPDEIQLISDQLAFGGKALVVDSSFFDFFDFKLLKGSKSVLNEASQIVLTESYAQKIFGDQDPIGQMVEVRCDQSGLYEVAGIVAAIPSNSSISFDFLVPRHSKPRWRRMPQEFILVDKTFEAQQFNETFAVAGQTSGRFPESSLSLLPFANIYNNHPVEISLFSKYGNATNLRAMRIIAGVILLITLLCFVNLQTTMHLSMIKKMGIQKVIGASKSALSIEILTSRLIYFFVALVVAFALYHILFPYYADLMELALDRRPWFELAVLAGVIGGVVLVSALFLLVKIFSIDAIQVLSGRLGVLRVPRLQRMLNTVQYAITALLLVGTTVVFLQLRFMLNKDTGLNQQDVVRANFFEMMPGVGQDSAARARRLVQHGYVLDQLQQYPGIETVSQGHMPIGSAAINGWKLIGGSKDFSSENTIAVDPDYDDLFGLQLTEGRFFADSLDANNELKVVINEAAKAYWDIRDINTASLATNTRGAEANSYEIIGVVKDFHYQHLSQEIKPLVLTYSTYRDDQILLRLAHNKSAETLAFMDQLFSEVNPKGVFTLGYMEDQMAAQYAGERRIGKINLAFSIVAILLASTGLFAFAYHETQRKAKEIGVRKVNGASVRQVLRGLILAFLKPVLLAVIIAFPLGWYLMDHWLQNFANRISLDWWIFAFVTVILVAIAVLTVGWQVLKTAQMNPVKALRDE